MCRPPAILLQFWNLHIIDTRSPDHQITWAYVFKDNNSLLLTTITPRTPNSFQRHPPPRALLETFCQTSDGPRHFWAKSWGQSPKNQGGGDQVTCHCVPRLVRHRHLHARLPLLEAKKCHVPTASPQRHRHWPVPMDFIPNTALRIGHRAGRWRTGRLKGLHRDHCRGDSGWPVSPTNSSMATDSIVVLACATECGPVERYHVSKLIFVCIHQKGVCSFSNFSI